MKAYCQKTELQALKTLVSGEEKVSSAVAAKSSDKLYHHPDIRAAVSRVMTLAKKDGEFPSAAELLGDPALDESSRSFLRQKLKGVPVAKNAAAAAGLTKSLAKFYQLRELVASCKVVLDTVADKDSVDIESVLEAHLDSLTKSRFVTSKRKLYHFGKGGSRTDKEIKRILRGNVAGVIPTGFADFDDVNGGFFEESLVILTANTGGLKSALAKYMASTMYLHGEDVAYVSLEMSFAECVYRLFSSLTGIDSLKFMLAKLTDKEKKKAWSAYKKFQGAGEKKGNRFTIMPVDDESVGIDEVLATLGPLGYKVIILDYVTLLADADEGDQQWKTLSAVARKAKKFAQRNNCVFILLAQLSDDDKIRYSRGITEHANNWWRWRLTDKERETGILQIHQGKARNQRVFSFEVGVNFNTFTFSNIGDAMKSDNGSAYSISDNDHIEDITSDTDIRSVYKRDSL